jgi:hypothetical protein
MKICILRHSEPLRLPTPYWHTFSLNRGSNFPLNCWSHKVPALRDCGNFWRGTFTRWWPLMTYSFSDEGLGMANHLYWHCVRTWESILSFCGNHPPPWMWYGMNMVMTVSLVYLVAWAVQSSDNRGFSFFELWFFNNCSDKQSSGLSGMGSWEIN